MAYPEGMRPRIGCALLAAGSSERLGRAKQFLDYAGQPLVRHIASVIIAARVDGVSVITGAHGKSVQRVLAGIPLEIVHNSAWEEGIAASIREAVRWASARGFSALLLTTCDQPYLDSEHLNRLVDQFTGPEDAVASRYAETLGIPALFGRQWYARLLDLHGDRGAGALLGDNPQTTAIDWADGAIDIDYQSDLHHLRAERVSSERPTDHPPDGRSDDGDDRDSAEDVHGPTLDLVANHGAVVGRD
jgi:molybdenum cofactor cytidylyltransferase